MPPHGVKRGRGGRDLRAPTLSSSDRIVGRNNVKAVDLPALRGHISLAGIDEVVELLRVEIRMLRIGMQVGLDHQHHPERMRKEPAFMRDVRALGVRMLDRHRDLLLICSICPIAIRSTTRENQNRERSVARPEPKKSATFRDHALANPLAQSASSLDTAATGSGPFVTASTAASSWASSVMPITRVAKSWLASTKRSAACAGDP